MANPSNHCSRFIWIRESHGPPVTVVTMPVFSVLAVFTQHDTSRSTHGAAAIGTALLSPGAFRDAKSWGSFHATSPLLEEPWTVLTQNWPVF